MQREARAAADQTILMYEDFEPSTTWARESGHDNLILQVQDFRKDQLKVQVTTSFHLIISGERPIGNNKWSHFRKQIPISTNYYIVNEITAKFENHKLYIKLPKHVSEPEVDDQVGQPLEKPASPSTDSVKGQTRAEELQQATQRAPLKTGSGAVEKQKSGGTGNNVNGFGDASHEEKEEATQEVPPKASGVVNKAADDEKELPETEKQPSIESSTSSEKKNDEGKGGDDERMKGNKNLGGSAATSNNGRDISRDLNQVPLIGALIKSSIFIRNLVWAFVFFLLSALCKKRIKSGL